MRLLRLCLFKGKNNTCISAAHTPTWSCTQAAESHGREGGGGHQAALCSIEGLEDSGYLEHDRAGLGVVHPLGAVQRILQHVFECCRQTRETEAISKEKQSVCV